MNFRSNLASRDIPVAQETPNVFVVDGDPMVRRELEVLIRSAGWQPRVFGSAEEFLTFPRAISPGCLLVEMDLPHLSGLDLQGHLLSRTELPVVFMSRQPEVQRAVQAVKAGAIEFLVKPLNRDIVLCALRQAIDCSHASLRKLRQEQALLQRYVTLSQREREVMGLVVTGRLNKQVGGELGISEITVKSHRGKLMRKMQAGSLAELVRMAARLSPGASAFPG